MGILIVVDCGVEYSGYQQTSQPQLLLGMTYQVRLIFGKVV
ncbi:MAG: hypothetical protein RR387_02635 [Clostridiales bacterium]